ncbi:MAG: hypothetical protein CTY10_09225 [Methylotenera sp.]|nr:MAG: hypothetical protein CTY10_09225 [Methylotenera sp.]
MYKKIISYLILLTICFIVTSAAFSGYFSKRAFYDTDKLYGDLSVINVFKGEAPKPYVYRQLLPYSATFIHDKLPDSMKEKVKNWITKDRGGINNNVIHNTYAQAIDSDKSEIIIQYYLLYIFSFISLFLSVLILRKVCLEFGVDKPSATVAPMLFILLLPYLQTEGGFFYDMTEIFFMATAVLFAQKKQYLFLIFLVAFATINKESFLAFTLTLIPFLIKDLGLKKAAVYQASLMTIAALINFWIKAKYAANSGGAVESHFIQQVSAFLNISSYFRYDFVYGIIAPKGYNILTILLLATTVKSSYHLLPRVAKQHTLAAFAVNLPLFLLFCFPGELRNLSFLFVSLNLIICFGISQYFRKEINRTA